MAEAETIEVDPGLEQIIGLYDPSRTTAPALVAERQNPALSPSLDQVRSNALGVQPLIMPNFDALAQPIQPVQPAGINDILSQVTDIYGQMRDLTGADEAEKAMRKSIALRQAEAARPATPMPEIPEPVKLPEKKPYQFRETYEAFQNPGVVLAMFASLFTRAPMTAALKAGAAAMTGFAQGDMEAAKKYDQDFQDNLDVALKQNRLEMDRYRTILEQRNISETERLAKIMGAAAAYKDEFMLASARQGDFSAAFSLYNTREQQQARLETARELAADRQERREETARHNAAIEAIRQQDANTRASRPPTQNLTREDRARYYVLDDKLASEGLTPQEQREYDVIVGKLFPVKTLATGDGRIAEVQPNVPSVAQPPQQAAPAAVPSPQPSSPASQVQTTQTTTPSGARVNTSGPPKDPPPTAQAQMINNAAKVKEAQDALETIERRAGAFGLGRYAASYFGDIGQSIWDQNNPEGRKASIAASRIAAITMHDLSGAAVTLSESPRFRPFIPTMADDAATTLDKIRGLQNALRSELTEWYNAYGPTSGYRQQPSIEQALSGLGPAPGTVEGGYRFKGGDPAQQSNWEKVE